MKAWLMRLQNHKMNRSARILVFVGALFLFLPAICFVYETVTGNFHAITAGEAYRSAQLDKKQYEYYVKKYSIGSVLNLRGKHPDEQWYNDEISVCSTLGLAHYDVTLSATSEPTAQDARNIESIFESAPRPLLLHCMAGADRSGLASAMWKVVVDGEPKSKAGRQLTILCGHLPFGKVQAMDRFYKKWNQSEHNRQG